MNYGGNITELKTGIVKEINGEFGGKNEEKDYDT